MDTEVHGAVEVCPVNSFNEWDPLEEVVVGRLEGATIPSNHITVTYDIPPVKRWLYKLFAGRRYPKFMIERAQRELDALINILKSEGVTVRRPDILNFKRRFKTPYWSSRGYCVACPRDGTLIVGDEIIETPMAWRSRFFENYAYRSLFKEYFAKGARWTAAPKPKLLDELYDNDFTPPAEGEPIRYLLTDDEPVFDAADFARCGKDIFVHKSNVTNATGIEWLRRHLGHTYRIHEIESRCRTPVHIDTTFVPLAPGKVLINPVYVDVDRLPPILRKWDILIAPEPKNLPANTYSVCSKWIAINVLMLDEKRVIVERSQEALIKALRGWGFKPIPCPMIYLPAFGGAFHCATLDVRRRGTLKSYF